MKKSKTGRTRYAGEKALAKLRENNARAEKESDHLRRLYGRNMWWALGGRSLNDIMEERALALVCSMSSLIRGHLRKGDRSDAWFGKWLRARMRLIDKYSNKQNAAVFHIDSYAI